MDARIKREEAIDERALSKYLRSIRTEEIKRIKAADVILCTCTTSATSRVRENTNIHQVTDW